MIKKLFFCGLMISFMLNAADGINQTDREFIDSILNKPALLRVQALESFINKTVSGKGVVETVEPVEEKDGYSSELKITIRHKVKDSNLIIIYRLFSSNDLLPSELIGKKVLFKGKLVLAVPLDSARTVFTCDILLEELSIYAD